MKKSLFVANATAIASSAFLVALCLASPALAALGAPPYLADLDQLRLWAMVVAVFIVFVGIVAIGSSLATGQWQRGAMGFLALVVGGGIIAQATGLTSGLTGSF